MLLSKTDFIYSHVVPKVHWGVVGRSSRSWLETSCRVCMCDDASAAAPPFLLMGWCSRLHVCRISLCLFLSWVWVRGRACLFAVPMSALPARGPSASSAGRLMGPFSHPVSQWHLTAASGRLNRSGGNIRNICFTLTARLSWSDLFRAYGPYQSFI